MSDQNLQLIDYVAYKLYEADCHAEAQRPTRWLCTREDVRAFYRQKAEGAHIEWTIGERTAKLEREKIGTSSV